jgi:DNA-binding MurR/RpiR family transcriptional regulator
MAGSRRTGTAVHGTQSEVLGLLASTTPQMSASEQRIAQFVLQDPAAAAGMSISLMASGTETSEASVVRFCRSIGFSGYAAFRLALASDLGRRQASSSEEELDSGITPSDDVATIISKVAHADARAIEATASRLDPAVLTRAVEFIDAARVVGVFGVGASAYVTLDIQLKLNRLGKTTLAWTDAHAALTSIAALNRGDTLLVISHSGSTPDVLDVISEFQRRGVRVVVVTNFPRSPGAVKADLVLLTVARETTFRSGATASRIAQLTVADCLCIAYAQRHWKATKAFLDESLAAVGRRSTSKAGRGDSHVAPASTKRKSNL